MACSKGCSPSPATAISISSPLFDALVRRSNYSGWVIVEAEQDPAIADPRAFARLGLGTLRDKARLAGLEEAA